jgi:predicted NAD/FAD-dependent oxidoreductase
VSRELGLAACGDFCGESSAQGAILSGLAAARALGESFPKAAGIAGISDSH